ncbi:WD40 repeat domain-containing protein [Stackebrandtia nassauensis]|uniref:WD-40 repeat protein n=1 Tax=Stackebrandtia nassauensis (strain DSM 44728 / CIP 108903 / NRRL B-16338 / NBRC 102104 / LLR-40K-21) TaxID=446470 RepID=D3Q9C8_STANL|nr:hypothetical protein [Stackebrandtia nassauensis]ADD42610.1 WD-40 repeat protein [Stackebrandtia nassauensis DSM 44728]
MALLRDGGARQVGGYELGSGRDDASPAVMNQVGPNGAPMAYVPPPRPPVPLLRRRGVIVGAVAALCVIVVAALAAVIVLRPQHTSGVLDGGGTPSEAALPSYAIADERTLDPPETLNALTFSPDGKLLATGSGYSRNTQLWDVDTGEQVAELKGTSPCAQEFSPDGKLLATGGCAGEETGVQLWDVRTEDKIATITKNDSEDLAFSPDGKTLATIGNNPHDGLRLWEVSTGDEIMHLDMEDAIDFTFSPDSATFAVTPSRADLDDPFRAELWDMRSGDKISSFTVNGGTVTYSPDGKTLITASCGGTVSRWEVRTGDKVDSHRLVDCFDLSFSSDSKVLAIVNLEFEEPPGTTLWSVETGDRLLTLSTQEAYHVAFSTTGKAVAVNTSLEANTHDEIVLWRLK